MKNLLLSIFAFALIDANGIVLQVIEASQKDVDAMPAENFKVRGVAAGPGAKWKEAMQDGSKGKNFPAKGYRYDAEVGGFVPPKAHASSALNKVTGKWELPVPYPSDGADYRWNEKTQKWEEPSIKQKQGESK